LWSSGGVVVVVVVAVYLFGERFESDKVRTWLPIYAIHLPFLVVTQMLLAFLQAQKKIKRVAVRQSMVKIQAVFVVVVFTWLWGFPGFFVGSIIGYIVGVIPVFAEMGSGFLKARTSFVPERFYRMAVFSMLANGVSAIGLYSDVLIMDQFSGQRDEIGYYSLAAVFLMAALQVTNTVQMIVLPYFSERSGDREWFVRKLWVIQIKMVGLAIVVAAGIYTVGMVGIPWMFGEAYSSTVVYLGILMIKYIIASSIAVAGVALVAKGLMHYNLAAVLVSVPVGLGITYWSLQTFGIIGVAWAQVINAIIYVFVVMMLFNFSLAKSRFGPA
jgi:O-antigen/teichoic acid export membrane protein